MTSVQAPDPTRLDPLITNDVYDIVLGVFEPGTLAPSQTKWCGCLYADIKGKNARILLNLSKKDSEAELDAWGKKMAEEKPWLGTLNTKLAELLSKQ